MEVPSIPALPPPDEIRRLAQEIVHRSMYDLGSTDDVPLVVRVLHMLRRIFGPLYDWFQSLWMVSPAAAALILVVLFGILIALIGHLVYSLRSALRAPDEVRSRLPAEHTATAAELEQHARAAAKKGEFVEAIRLLFKASLLTLENAQQRIVRRGTTNREYLRRYKNTPAFEPLFFLVELLDRKWYAGVPCSQQDYDESLRAFAAIQQTVRSAKPETTEGARAQLP